MPRVKATCRPTLIVIWHHIVNITEPKNIEDHIDAIGNNLSIQIPSHFTLRAKRLRKILIFLWPELARNCLHYCLISRDLCVGCRCADS